MNKEHCGECGSTVFTSGFCHDYQVRVREILLERLQLKTRDIIRLVTSYHDPICGQEDHNINFDVMVGVRKGCFLMGDWKHPGDGKYQLGDFFIGQTRFDVWRAVCVDGKYYNSEIHKWVKL